MPRPCQSLIRSRTLRAIQRIPFVRGAAKKEDKLEGEAAELGADGPEQVLGVAEADRDEVQLREVRHQLQAAPRRSRLLLGKDGVLAKFGGKKTCLISVVMF